MRHDIESTAIERPQFAAVRCAGVYAKTKRQCNRMLAWLDGTARLTCPRCGTTLVYTAVHGPVRARQP